MTVFVYSWGISQPARVAAVLLPLVLRYLLDVSAQSANYTAIPRLMLTSVKIVRVWKYTSMHDTLRTPLNWAPAASHILFVLWTSPNHRSFLAIVGHYLELATGESRDVLLGFRRLRDPHSGENQADGF